MIPIAVMPERPPVPEPDERSRRILQDYEHRFRLMEEHLSLGIIQIRPGPEGRILSANRNMARMLGYDRPADLVGRSPRDFMIQPADFEAFTSTLHQDGNVTGMEMHLKRKDSSATWVSLQGWNLSDPVQGGTVLECFAEDITEHRVFEQESQYHESELNRYAVALSQANKKLNLLSSITRHDILNKLTGLLGFIELMKSDYPDPQIQKILKTQEEIIWSITLHINFAKDYQNIGIESPRWFDLQSVIAGAVATLPLQGVSVEIGTKDLYVYADPMIEKVFYNLIENALRHGDHVTRIRFSADADETGARIVCEDNGCGVPQKFKEDIFLRKHFSHTGFGLFLSRDILEITGFTIRETGTPVEGARFEIAIPPGYFRTGGAGTRPPV